MTFTEVKEYINQFIITNGNREITAAILNPVLQAIIDWANSIIGDLNNLNTTNKSNIVAAINEVNNNIGNITINTAQVYSGLDDPNTTPPPSFSPGDFYIQLDLLNDPIALFLYDGFIWQNVTESAGSVLSVTGPTVDNTDPANPIVNVPSLQQVTSKLLDGDGYAETTDGIKASKLKVVGFEADENGFSLLSAYDDTVKTIEANNTEGQMDFRNPFGDVYPNSSISHSSFSVSGEFKVVYLELSGLKYQDKTTGKSITFQSPTSIVGTDKEIEVRDLAGTMALLSDIPTADDLGAEKVANKGVANGYAPLNSSTKIDTVFLPDSVLGQMLYGGLFNANTAVATLTNNAKTRLGTTDATITLTNDTTSITGYLANEGIYYISSVAGTFAGLSIDVGDWLLSIGTGWAKIDNTDAIASFNGRTGVIVLIASDVADLVHAATSKTTIVDADEIGGTNSATSFSLIRITALNFYNYCKEKLDFIFATIASPTFTGTVTTPAIVVSGETASTIASFDASKNIKSLPLSTYPSLTEIANVKGVNAPIQPQIDARKKQVYSTGTSVTHTGSTSETTLLRITIPAGTLTTTDWLNINRIVIARGLGQASSVEIKLKLSTSATLPSGTTDQIGTCTLTNTSRSNIILRGLWQESGNINFYNPTLNTATDILNANIAFGSAAFNNTSTTYYLYITATLVTGTDNVILRAVDITN